MNVRDHVLRGTSTTLRQTFSAGAADGNVTVEILRGDGVQVVAPTVATPVTPNPPTVPAGTYDYVMAVQSEVELLTVIWRGSWGGVAQELRSQVMVVGAFLFTIAQMRAYDNGALSDTTKYPDSMIRETRAGIAEFFEDVCDQSFIPRYGASTISGEGTPYVVLTDYPLVKLLRSKVDGSSASISGVSISDHGKVYRPAGWPQGYRNLLVEYEYGMQAVPYRIHQAALVLARYELVSRDISDRAISLSNELGAVRLSVPGRDYPTGLPFVDATLNRYERKVLIGL